MLNARIGVQDMNDLVASVHDDLRKIKGHLENLPAFPKGISLPFPPKLQVCNFTILVFALYRQATLTSCKASKPNRAL